MAWGILQYDPHIPHILSTFCLLKGDYNLRSQPKRTKQQKPYKQGRESTSLHKVDSGARAHGSDCREDCGSASVSAPRRGFGAFGISIRA